MPKRLKHYKIIQESPHASVSLQKVEQVFENGFFSLGIDFPLDKNMSRKASRNWFNLHLSFFDTEKSGSPRLPLENFVIKPRDSPSCLIMSSCARLCKLFNELYFLF